MTSAYLLLLSSALQAGVGVAKQLETPYTNCSYDPRQSLFDFASKDIEEKEMIPLKSYKGKVLLVVNLASF